MHLFLAIICLAQLCSAQNSAQAVDGFPNEIEYPKINKEQINHNKIKENPPSYRWQAILWPTSSFPSDVVVSGIALCGKLYVGRAWYKGNLLPAKVCSSDGKAYVSYQDSEVILNESQVLCTEDAIWKPVNKTRIPTSAFPVGNTENGELLYTGR